MTIIQAHQSKRLFVSDRGKSCASAAEHSQFQSSKSRLETDRLPHRFVILRTTHYANISARITGPMTGFETGSAELWFRTVPYSGILGAELTDSIEAACSGILLHW